MPASPWREGRREEEERRKGAGRWCVSLSGQGGVRGREAVFQPRHAVAEPWGLTGRRVAGGGAGGGRRGMCCSRGGLC